MKTSVVDGPNCEVMGMWKYIIFLFQNIVWHAKLHCSRSVRKEGTQFWSRCLVTRMYIVGLLCYTFVSSASTSYISVYFSCLFVLKVYFLCNQMAIFLTILLTSRLSSTLFHEWQCADCVLSILVPPLFYFCVFSSLKQHTIIMF